MSRRATTPLHSMAGSHLRAGRDRKEGENMPREKELLRDNIVRIKEKYPDKELLRQFEVAQYLGVSVKTVRKRFTFDRGYISVVKLASELS